MKQSLSRQNLAFQKLYQTGSDTWTHLDYHNHILKLLPKLGQTIGLEIGFGRGVLLKKIINKGGKIIGMENQKMLVDDLNHEIKKGNLGHRGRAVFGDATELGFIDQSFDFIIDAGCSQHNKNEAQKNIKKEVYRCLKPGGIYIQLFLSKNTKHLLGKNPKRDNLDIFEKFNLEYNLCSKTQIEEKFSTDMHEKFYKELRLNSHTDPMDQAYMHLHVFEKPLTN